MLHPKSNVKNRIQYRKVMRESEVCRTNMDEVAVSSLTF